MSADGRIPLNEPDPDAPGCAYVGPDACIVCCSDPCDCARQLADPASPASRTARLLDWIWR